MRKPLLFFLLLTISLLAKAQLVVNAGVSAATLLSGFAGSGLTISNLTITCPSNAYGTFSNGNTTNMGITNGAIFTTGNASGAIGPNNSGSSGTCNGTSSSDPDLVAIEPQAIEDLCVVEFDIVPQCNQLTLKFVFGSEEYPEFVNASFNDAFGFFISGPGPACQANYYNHTNVATLPNNTTPVSIDNVNPGSNSAYYVNNIGGSTIQYDGFTTVLTRVVNICPCQSYHFKIAIADAGDCYYDSGVLIDFLQCTQFMAATTSQTATTCAGNNGSASITMTNGVGPYTYSWSPAPGGGQGTANATGLTGNTTYTISVDDAVTCSPSYTTTVAVVQGAGPSIALTQTNVSCAGANNGVATASVSGGLTPYTYTWSPSGGNSATASSLSPGTYTVRVKDASNCISTQTLSITQPTALSATTTQTNILCNGGATGSAGVSVSGGTGGYTYTWSPSGGNAATASGLAQNTYTATIRDANNCVLTKTVTLAQPPAISAAMSHTNVSCNGGNNGVASVSVSGGIPGYTYTWSPSGGNAATASALAQGSYTVAIKDANSCPQSATVSITEPTALTTGVTSTSVSCFGQSTGSATTSVSGGTAGYTYTWSPSGGNAATASGLAQGTYTVNVRDANSCPASATLSITQPSSITAITSQTNVACSGATNGVASVSASGGTPGYTYTWSPSGGNAATASGIGAGSYTVTIADAHSCTKTATVLITSGSSFTLSASTASAGCFGGTGSGTVSVSGGTPGYTYTWSPSGGNAATASGLIAGAYSVTVKDINNCSGTQTLNITQPSSVTATTSQTNVACNGGGSGIASVSVSGGTPGYTYTWSPSGGNAATATVLIAGTYTCTIKDANNCASTKTFTITQPAALSATGTQTNVLCNGGNTGIASVSVSGGTSAYTYSWAPTAGSGASLSSLAAGTYSCLIKDANNCSLTQTFVITAPPALSSSSVQANVLCYGAGTGSAGFSISGGTPGYTYSWTPNSASTPSVTGLTAGNYTFTVKDANNCVLSKTLSITQPSSLTAISSQTNVSCNGAGNGAASVSVTGGVAAYSYTWSPSGGNGSTASGLGPATYTCTIRDANNCSITQTVSITQPAALLATGSQTNALCNGGTGTASVSVSGGTPAYTYSWAPTAGSGSSLSGLTAGTYSCVVKDANNCSLTQTFVITMSTALSSSSVQANALCYGASTGSAGFSISGGTPGYTYSWTPNSASTPSVTGLAAGNYTFTVKDANNCVLNKTFSITQPSSLTAVPSQTNVLCNGNATGQAAVSISGGAASYSYSWSPGGAATPSVGAIVAGSYSCFVTDGNSCTLTQTITITEPPALSAVSSQTNVACNGGNNGQAMVSLSGGVGPYTYTWSPVASGTYSVGGLSFGTYTCLAADANNCQLSTVFSITQQSSLVGVLSHTDVSCFGGNSGSAGISITGGAPGYTYTWSPSGGNAALASSLTAGVYTCTIADANNCSDTKTVSIIEPTALAASFTQTNVSCYGLSNGAAIVSTSGGTPGYSYTWTPGAASTATALSLSAGVYTLTSADANNCVLTKTLSITQPSSLTATSSQTNVSCYGAANGTASVSIGGGTVPYTYTWTPSGGNGAAASPLAPGSYTCNTTDANGCAIAQTFSITEPAALTISLSHTNVLCYAGNNGAAASGVTGGMGTYSYTWLPSGGNGATASSLTAGNYTCIVVDANGCNLSATVNISQPAAPLAATTTQSNVLCNGGNTGQATVNVSGGTPSYSYTWSPSGGNAAMASSLVAGTYTVLILDANACAFSQTLTLSQPAAPLSASATQSNVLCNGGNTGQASVSVSGGTPAYSYTWSASGVNTYSTGGLTAGTYSCFVSDANGCTLIQTVTITEPAALAAVQSQTDVVCNGGNTGAASVSVSGGTGAYTYSWSPAASSSNSVSSLVAGNYTCVIHDANSCVLTSTFTINQQSPLVSVISDTNVSCNGGSDGSANMSVSGGTPGYTYTWTPSGGNSALAAGLQAGTYVCTIEDLNHCSDSKTVTITEPLSLSATHTQTNVSCSGFSNGVVAINAAGGTPAYSYSWTPAVSSGSVASGLAAGSYTCVVKDANGCTVSHSVTVRQPSPLAASPSFTNVSCNGANNGSITVNASGGTPSYSYTWNPAVSSGPSAVNLSPGNYTCTVADTNGCSIIQTFTITQPQTITASLSQSPSDCGGSTGSATIAVSGGITPYTYTWSPTGGNSAIASNISTGTYSCTVMDDNLCTQTFTTAVGVINPTVTTLASQQAICPAQTATFTSSGGSTYTWSPATGLSAPNSSVTTASPPSTTIYTVTGANAYGCTSTATLQLTVYASPVITVTASQPTICAQSSATLNASGANTYTWSPSTGLSGTSGNTTVATLTTGNTYTVDAIDANGCAGSQTIQVSVNPLPVITASAASASICTGSSTTLNASGASTYTWSTGTVSSSIPVSPTAATIYTVTGTDANGCQSDTTVSVGVNPLPVLSVNGVTTICQGQSTTISAGGATSYTWSTGQNGNIISPSPSSSTTYSVIGEDNNGCINTLGIAITVLITPTLGITGDNEICLGDNTTLVASGAGTYTWSTGDNGNTISPAPGASSIYTVSSGVSPCTSSTTFAVTVYTPAPVVATPASTLINYGQSTPINAGSTAGTYQWQPPTGLSCSNCANPVATPEKTTEYVVTTTDEHGCRSTDTVLVEVDLTCGEVFVPEAFSPNGDGNNDTWCVYGNCIQELNVELYDRWGQKVFEGYDKSSCWDGRIMGEMQNSNVYMYQVRASLINGEKVFKKGNMTLVR